MDIEQIEQKDPRLGRNKVHDERSRGFAALAPIDKSTWHTRTLRVYDPLPNPNQTIGNCTGTSKCSQLNTVGNRVTGRVLNMAWALALYHRNTQLDPFPGEYPPDDTGSSGLASAKSAIELGLGGRYEWEFRGADGVAQNIMQGRPMSVGTYWYDGMFSPDRNGLIKPTGAVAGGHQYLIHGYNKSKDTLVGRCWWGSFKTFNIRRGDLDMLIQDGGDAHFQATV